MKLFLCGDVMTGRGIDQVLPHPSEPTIYERMMTSAASYVDLAEHVNGPIPRPVAFGYIWGDLLDEQRFGEAGVRIVNLETSVTANDEPCPKGINYRMHPANVDCLVAAGIDCCVLANNHTLDWGIRGLEETCAVLSRAGIAVAGAGTSVDGAAQPAALTIAQTRRVLVFGVGAESSGIPASWAATSRRPGVNLLPDLSASTAERLASYVRSQTLPGDIVVLSVHWGDNWGYAVPEAQRAFAHHLIDSGAVDVLHGHSSHHPKSMEIRQGKLILYGCGDFINDYEGIGGYERYRPDLGIAYFVDLDDDSGRLLGLDMVVFRRRRFRLERATRADTQWMQSALSRHSELSGARLQVGPEASILLRP